MSAPRNRAPRGNRGVADGDTEESSLWVLIQSLAQEGKDMQSECNSLIEEYNGLVADFKKRERDGNRNDHSTSRGYKLSQDD